MTQVYKYVNKQSNIDGSELIQVITKTNLLAIISIFATLLHAIGAMLAHSPSTKSVHFEMIANLLFTFDLTTNFWCILLSYRGYNDWYLKICGCCDSLCTVCWYKIVGNTKNESESNVDDESNRVIV